MATTISFPDNNSIIQGVWDVTATSNDSALTGIEFRVDGVLVSTDTVSPYIYVFDTTLLNNKVVSVQATSVRSAGSPTQDTNSVTVSNSKAVQFPATQDVNVTNATLEVQSSPIPGALSDVTIGQFSGLMIALFFGLVIIVLLVKRYSPRSRR